MFVGIDIAHRMIWLRKDAYSVPLMLIAARCALIESACAFRQTWSFL